MYFRHVLLALGLICLIGGIGLSMFWLRGTGGADVQGYAPLPPPTAALCATKETKAGTLLRNEDIAWKEVPPESLRPGYILRGQTSEGEILGAITRRDVASGEPFNLGELVKPGERQFLSAVLTPGTRAASIAVSAPEGAAGLVLPGDYVDVILTQTFQDAAIDLARKSIGETVLRRLRVLAVDQLLASPQKKPASEAAPPASDIRTSRTVTLEVSEREAEMLFVAVQLGKLQLAVRPLEGGGTVPPVQPKGPIWASDVSPALKSVTRKQQQLQGNSIEGLIRLPPSAAAF